MTTTFAAARRAGVSPARRGIADAEFGRRATALRIVAGSDQWKQVMTDNGLAPCTLAFCTPGGVGVNNQAKAPLTAALRPGIAKIGLDNPTGMPRFTFGELHPMDGIDVLVAIVGLFAVAEVFHFIECHGTNNAIDVKSGKISIPRGDLRKPPRAMARGPGIGVVARTLPEARGSATCPVSPVLGSAARRDGGGLFQGFPADRVQFRHAADDSLSAFPVWVLTAWPLRAGAR